MSFDMPPDDDPHGECRHEIHRLQGIIDAIRAKLPEIVCTEGIDKGIVLLPYDGPTHPEVHDGKTIQVYDHVYFSPLGDALIELWELTEALPLAGAGRAGESGGET